MTKFNDFELRENACKFIHKSNIEGHDKNIFREFEEFRLYNRWHCPKNHIYTEMRRFFAYFGINTICLNRFEKFFPYRLLMTPSDVL